MKLRSKWYYIKIHLEESEEVFEGKVVGVDDSLDIALIRIDSKDSLPYVELGSSKRYTSRRLGGCSGSPLD